MQLGTDSCISAAPILILEALASNSNSFKKFRRANTRVVVNARFKYVKESFTSMLHRNELFFNKCVSGLTIIPKFFMNF